MAASQPSLLEIVQECHDDAYLTDATLAIFEPDGVHVGYIQPVVRDAIIQTEEKRQQNGQRPVFRVDAPPAGRSDWRIRFVDGVDDAQARTDAVAEVLQDWREQKLFPDPLDGWFFSSLFALSSSFFLSSMSL